MGYRRLSVAACVTTAFLSACSLLVSTSGLTEGGREGEGADAKAEESTDAADSAADAIANDAPTDRFDAAARRFCELTSHAYCEDFDGVPVGPDAQVLKGGGAVTTDLGAISLPRSLSCRAPSSATADTSARLRIDRPSVPGDVRIEFDAKLCPFPVNGLIEYFKLEFDSTFRPTNPGFGDAFIGLVVDARAHRLVRDGWDPGGTFFDVRSPLPAITSDVWHHFVVRSKLSTTSGDVQVDVDGARLIDLTGVQTLTAGATGMRLILGAFTNRYTLPCVVKLDNVTID